MWVFLRIREKYGVNIVAWVSKVGPIRAPESLENLEVLPTRDYIDSFAAKCPHKGLSIWVVGYCGIGVIDNLENLGKGIYSSFLADWYPDFLDADNYVQPFLQCSEGTALQGCAEGVTVGVAVGVGHTHETHMHMGHARAHGRTKRKGGGGDDDSYRRKEGLHILT